MFCGPIAIKNMVKLIKNIELRYHDYSDTVYIVEPIIDYPNMDFKKLDANSKFVTTQTYA